MTLIELYDKSPLNNIIGVLSLKPEKVVFVGPSHRMFDDVDRITHLLSEKGAPIEVECHIVNLDEPESVRKTLSEIIEDEPDCVFEMTGGEDQILLIAGDLIEEHRLQSQHTDIRSGKTTDTDGDGTIIPTAFPILSVSEIIALHGGTATGCALPDCPEDESDVLWNMTRKHSRHWNERIGMLALHEKNRYTESTCSVYICGNDIAPQNRNKLMSTLEELRERDIIKNLVSLEGRTGFVSYTYTKPYYHAMFSKVGNLLEHKVFYELSNAAYAGGHLFNDVSMGVKIQWDDEAPSTSTVPYNEIDVIAVRGVQPLFISCKGGEVSDDELYKFFTVSYLFGGEYARKMLVMTDMDTLSDITQKRIRRRAVALDIQLVEKAKDLTGKDWDALLRKTMGFK